MSEDGGRLREAVERLYSTFGSYPLAPTTDVCWHCHTPEEERVLHLVPLRQLTPDAVSGFAGDALMTWGDLADLKHLLPRLFEIVAFDRFTHDHPDIETVLGALGRGEWTTWPAEEQEAVRAFLGALWAETLHTWPSHHEIETVIAAIAQAEADLSPYLAEWDAATGSAPVLHFSDLLGQNAMWIALGQRLGNPWLGGHPDREAQVRTWLQQARSRFAPKMEALFLVSTDEQAVDHLSAVLDVLEG